MKKDPTPLYPETVAFLAAHGIRGIRSGSLTLAQLTDLAGKLGVEIVSSDHGHLARECEIIAPPGHCWEPELHILLSSVEDRHEGHPFRPSYNDLANRMMGGFHPCDCGDCDLLKEEQNRPRRRPMTNRETAIENAEKLSQQIFEERFYCPTETHYFLDRAGNITTERGKDSLHLFTSDKITAYRGPIEDYRDLDLIGALSDRLPAGRKDGEVLTDMDERLDDDQFEIVSNHPDGLVWHDGKWLAPGEPADWDTRTGEDPALPLLEAIDYLEYGWFADEPSSRTTKGAQQAPHAI